MKIGKPKRVYTIEPLRSPVPEAPPKLEQEPVPAPKRPESGATSQS